MRCPRCNSDQVTVNTCPDGMADCFTCGEPFFLPEGDGLPHGPAPALERLAQCGTPEVEAPLEQRSGVPELD